MTLRIIALIIFYFLSNGTFSIKVFILTEMSSKNFMMSNPPIKTIYITQRQKTQRNTERRKKNVEIENKNYYENDQNNKNLTIKNEKDEKKTKISNLSINKYYNKSYICDSLCKLMNI